jgi:uncharacterized membrane protein YedE/YeeE
MKILFAQNSTKIRILGLLIGIGLVFIGPKYSLGFILGMALSELYLSILNAFLSKALAQRYYSRGIGSLIFISRNILLIIPFVFVLKFPTYIDIFAAVLGLLYFKICIYIKYLFFRDKDPK